MAKTGKKVIVLGIKHVDEIELIIDFADKKASSSGIRAGFEYTHDGGLKITMAGPKDKINLFEHQVRDYLNELRNPPEEEDFEGEDDFDESDEE